MILSNLVNERVHIDDYTCDPMVALFIEFLRSKLQLPYVAEREKYLLAAVHTRRQQTPSLMRRLRDALITCQHREWLANRNVRSTSGIYSIDYHRLSKQDLLDLHILPDDHILEVHGERVVDGPVFLDVRNGNLLGLCVRNVSDDLAFVCDAKYTFSNYGWFLYGYDLYGSGDEVYLTEGVFDALALRHYGYNAIALGTCHPQVMQLSVLKSKFDNLVICFDNDFHGRFGAYYTSCLIGAPVVFPSAKDVATHFEMGERPKLTRRPREELREAIYAEAAEYNRRLASGWIPERPLPYNSKTPPRCV